MKAMSSGAICSNSSGFHVLDNGLQVPKFITQEEIDKLKDVELYPDDVWVVTYPKCGTTWTQQIVRLIRNKGIPDEKKINAAVPWLEAVASPSHRDANIDSVQRPRAFKSHFPYHLLPCGPPHTTPCKYIFVTRNPKDVAVSLYFHIKLRHLPDIDWNSFWKKYIAGDLEFGNYLSDHLLSWWPHRDDDNVLFLKYEDMKKDLKHSVSTIASFIEADLSDDIISKIADMTSFAEMKKDKTANYSWERFHKETPFLRKGEVGDWKNFLTPEQSAEMDALCAEILKDTDITFEY